MSEEKVEGEAKFKLAENSGHIWQPSDLWKLQRDTSEFCPAGDWFDIRGHVVGLYWMARNLNWRDPRTGGPIVPPSMLEIGTREGPSTLALLMAARETGGKLLSIECDPDNAAVTKSVVEANGLAPWWDLTIGRSEEVAADIPDDGLDLVLIDGDHGEAQVTLDTLHYAPKVRVGGLLLFHDYFSEVACQGWPVSGPWPSYASVPVESIRASGKWEVAVYPWSFGLAVCRRLR